MKPFFEDINNVFCDICNKKKQWLIAIYKKGKCKNKLDTICQECINEMNFALGKAMKPQNFKE